MLETVVRQDESEVDLRHLLESMRNGTANNDRDWEYACSRALPNLSAEEQALYQLPGQGTLCTYATWEEAWLDRNQRMLKMLNEGYETPSLGHVEGVPVYKILATNVGRHARAKGADMFNSLPGSTHVARGLQIRLTINLFGDIGQSWGLVNGAIGLVVEVIYPTTEAAADMHAIPTVVAHFEDYCGPAFCAARPKLVVLYPTEREGDCSCKCTRRSAPFRVCEGTTTHSVEGITVGAKKQVKRIGISMGAPSVEARARGLSYVAQSRPQGTADFAYVKPFDRERLAAIGTGEKATQLKAKMAAFESRQSADATTLLSEGFYEPLLRWAEDYALYVHGIHAPWRMPPAEPEQAPSPADNAPPPGDVPMDDAPMAPPRSPMAPPRSRPKRKERMSAAENEAYERERRRRM